MQKILALDLGSYSVKALEIVNTFQSYTVVGYYENHIPEIPGVDSEVIGMTAIKQLFVDNRLEADRVFTAIMGLHVSCRILHLPNVKRKKDIPNFVVNEMEELAPFPLDEAVLDHQLLSQKEGLSSVLVALSRKDRVEGYLEALKSLNIEPKIIDVDFLTYMNLFPFVQKLNQDVEDVKTKQVTARKSVPTLIIDIGHLKTTVVLFNDDKLVATRVIPRAGRYFTTYLQQNLKVSFAEAQRLKHDVKRLEFSPTANATPGNETSFNIACHLTAAVCELSKELARTIHSFKAHEHVDIKDVIITGGSASISNLPEYLQNFLQLPVRRMSYETSKLKFEDRSLMGSNVLPQALAIGLRGVGHKEQSKINLRRGELAFVGSYDSIFRQSLNIGIMAFALLFCLVGSYGLRWLLYSKQIESLEKQYKTQVVQIVGNDNRQLRSLSKSVDFKVYHNTATKVIKDDISQKEAVLSTFNPKSLITPLQVLSDISNVMPKDLYIEITSFSVQGANVLIEAETDSFASSDSITQQLKTVSSLKNVERKTQENKPGSDGKILKISFAGTVNQGE